MHLAGFSGIGSGFLHVSPATTGKKHFYDVIKSYVHLYGSIEPGIWTGEIMNRILEYCRQVPDEMNDGEDILLISQSHGNRP
jgi:hypothetical protein